MFHVEHKTVNWKTSCLCRPSSYDLGTVNVLLDQIRILKWRVKMSMNLELIHLFLKNSTTNCIQQWPPIVDYWIKYNAMQERETLFGLRETFTIPSKYLELNYALRI